MLYIRVKGYGNVALKCNSQPISRVLYPLMGWLSFIYAWCHHNAKAFYPPARASNPQTPVYANLQPPRHTARTSLHGRWALTPPSHPYPFGRLFSSALLCLHKQLSVRKWSALCCPDFPPLPYSNGDRPADCFFFRCKYREKATFFKIQPLKIALFDSYIALTLINKCICDILLYPLSIAV